MQSQRLLLAGPLYLPCPSLSNAPHLRALLGRVTQDKPRTTCKPCLVNTELGIWT